MLNTLLAYIYLIFQVTELKLSLVTTWML